MLRRVDTVLFPWCADETSTPINSEMPTALHAWHENQRAKEGKANSVE